MKSSALGCPTDPVPPPEEPPLDRLEERLPELEDPELEYEDRDPPELLPVFPPDDADVEDEPVEEPAVLLEEPEEVPLALSSP